MSSGLNRLIISLVILTAVGRVLHAESSTDTWRQQMEQKVDALTQELEKAKLSPSEASSTDQATALAPLSVAPYSFGPAAGKSMASIKACRSAAMGS